MHIFEKDISGFRGMNLQDLNRISLMKRFDTKFVFHRDKLSSLLESLRRGYSILDVNGIRTFVYQTLYYDTPDNLFYRQHHDKRVNRYKIRCRKYDATHQCFLEVKWKNNKGKTIKQRMLLSDGEIRKELSGPSRTFIRNCLPEAYCGLIHDLRPTLWVSYTRLTLANAEKQERITVDADLTFFDDSGRLSLENLVVAEFKHPDYIVKSSFLPRMKRLNISPAKFSKYCTGIVFLEKDMRINRFKKRILALQKAGIIHGFHHPSGGHREYRATVESAAA